MNKNNFFINDIVIFVVYFFIVIVNILFYNILNRIYVDKLIFENAKNQLRTTISCINDHWFVVRRSTRFLDLLAVTRNSEYLNCNINPISSDLLESCGLNGKLNNRSEYCSQALLELMFTL
ncbi:IMV membrane protein entry/fusion complex component (Cop-A21L) [Adoxophyes honmai entomopoxvirus 'L']|uniref:IMV membrane protein entry/fusion complex component (Cop-A21L) n=1 Tax=Adoxophyes honmai entomopoxvirus 'L' TaxID=1293540 RepID=A0A916KP69_9POXV|nr:IMV membrane protein entry/fusion complex component (Cop-A21L) [Adoxophyes honmai entomopoxvirus 'L']CCU55547.1 IMV membrane protein entry/fusion complex component (Cop-A21L) [Adoxophyes honmai entomopoxvirus 'L']